MKCYDSEKQASLNIKTESLTELYVCGHGRCDDFIGGHLQPEKKKRNKRFERETRLLVVVGFR